MADIEFDDFIASLRRSLTAVQAGFAAQARGRLEQLRQIDEAGGTEALEWQLSVDLRGADGEPERKLCLPLWSMRTVRAVRLSETTLELPVSVETAAEGRLSFVIRGERVDETSMLRLSWRASPDDSLRVTYDDHPVRIFNEFLGRPAGDQSGVWGAAP
jgi:hypothetical protein